MTGKLMEYFNRQPRLGVISTSGKDGRVDSAVYGSPQMIDEKTVMVALARGRTWANLQDNPHAVYMIMQPGEGLMDWKGVRVYLQDVGVRRLRAQAGGLQEGGGQDRGRGGGGDDRRAGHIRGKGDPAADRLRAGVGEGNLNKITGRGHYGQCGRF